MDSRFQMEVPLSPSDAERRIAAGLAKPECRGHVGQYRFDACLRRPTWLRPQMVAPRVEGTIEAREAGSVISVVIHASPNIRGRFGLGWGPVMCALWLVSLFEQVLLLAREPSIRKELEVVVGIIVGALGLGLLLAYIENGHQRDVTRLQDEIREWFNEGARPAP